MNEMDQLKQNTERQRAKDTVNGIMQYYVDSWDEAYAAKNWTLRATLLTASVACTFLSTIILGVILSVPEDVLSLASDWIFTIFILCVFREHWHDREWKETEGRLDGVYHTLVKLGWIDDDLDLKGRDPKKVKNQSMFSRYKELFERIGKNKEAYA